ncbi:hypothetical protein Plhal304r1_c030g0098821 [Plasmopara halstedii]
MTLATTMTTPKADVLLLLLRDLLKPVKFPRQQFEQTPLEILLIHSDVLNWAQSVITSYKKDVEKAYESIYLVLLEHADDKAKLSEVIQESMSWLGLHLQKVELTYWHKNNYSLKQVFDNLELRSLKMLDNSRLKRWLAYAHEKQEDGPKKLWSILNSFDDDGYIVQLLLASKGSTDPEQIGKKLEDKLVTKWSENRVPSRKVFGYFGVKKNQYELWSAYFKSSKIAGNELFEYDTIVKKVIEFGKNSEDSKLVKIAEEMTQP